MDKKLPAARPFEDRKLLPIGLGGATLSLADVDRVAAAKVIRAGLEAGIGLIDTARAYATIGDPTHNESLIGEVLAGNSFADDVIVVTKGGHFRRSRESWGIDASPQALRANCEDSLRALRRDVLDVYLLHKPDPKVDFLESVDTLKSLRLEGKVKAIGLSNVTLEQVMAAREVAPVTVIENSFSAFDQSDRALVDYADSNGVSYLAYSPLGGASRKSSIGEALPVATSIALEAGVSSAVLLLAWILRQSPTVLAISGASRIQTVTDSACAPGVSLPAGLWLEVEDEIASRWERHRIQT